MSESTQSTQITDYITVHAAVEFLNFKNSSSVYQLMKSGAVRFHEFKSASGASTKVVLHQDIKDYGVFRTQRLMFKQRKGL